MTLSKKTKDELITEVKKLQRKIESLQKKKIADAPASHASLPNLRDSKWESFFKNSLNTIVIVNRSGVILDINKLSKGRKKEEVIGKKVYDFVDKASVKEIRSSIANVFDTGKSQEYNSWRTDAKGQTYYYISKVTAVIEDKKVVAAVIDASEITREISVQKKLKESEERFRTLAQNATDVVFRYQVYPEYKQEYISPSIENITGYSPEDYYKDPLLSIKIIHPEDQHIVHEQSIGEVVGKPFALRWVHKKGHIIWAETVNSPVKDKKGRVIAYEGISRDITERKKAELALHESEAKFRMLTENATDLIYKFCFYPQAHYQYVSPAANALTGYSPEEFYADPLLGFRIVHPNDVHLLGDSERLIKEKAKLRDVKEPEIIVRWIKKDGSTVWTETRNKPIFDENNRLIAIEGISRDVTKQKLSEEKSKDSEERFKQLSNATFEGIVFSENGKIIDANDQFVEMYGFRSSKEILGKNLIDDFVVEEQKSIARKYVRLTIPKPFEVDTLKKDGTIITVETKGQNIPYLGRNIRATVIYNITERKQYESSLRESERTLSTLMNNLPGMAYRCENDEKWTMRFVSKGFQELTGYNPKDIINNKKRAFSDIIHPKDRNLGKEEIRKALKAQAPFEIEYRLITASGEPKWVWEKGEGVFSDDGKLLFLEGFITDIGEKKQFELELKRSRENYKSLVDYSPDGVFIHIDGKVVFANPSALKLAEIEDREEAMKYTLFDFLLPEYHEQVMERVKDVATGASQSFIEVQIKTLKGEIKEVETKPILIKFNGKDAILTVVHDISTQKLLLREQARAQIAEETNELLEQEITKKKVIQLQLLESQKYTRLIINGSIDMICASDKKGFITEFNQAAQRTFGYTAEEVIGQHVSMLYENPNERIKITDEELYKKGVYAGEVTNIRKNGEKFIAYLSASVLKNEDGEVIGAMGVSRDISELKRAEEALRAQSAKFNAIIESSSHVIWTVDKNICLTTFNHNYAKQQKARYGIHAKIGLCMTKGDAISTVEYNNFWIKKYESAFAGIPQYFETQFFEKDGTETWREIYLNPIYGEDGEINEVSGIGHDITEKKKSEEKIKLSLQEKEVLLKEVHHRVKNNLQVISSILNLQSSYVKDEGTLNILKESQNRIKSMAFIHESLYQTKDFSSINFTEYVINLSQNLIHSYSNFDHEIKLNLDIQNVFLNLDLAIPCGLIINEIVSNALKYAFVDNSLGAEITISMKIEGDNLVLLIGDNGKGLPKEIDYRNTESLGLQLVVTLTDQLSGVIELDRKKGTNYTIIFKQNQVKNRI
jgi:PAS domain S-box-containing protein